MNSIASASLLAYWFHFSQNSTVTWLVAERFSGIAPESLVPLNDQRAVGSSEIAPGWPKLPPLIVPLLVPLLSEIVGPADSPRR